MPRVRLDGVLSLDKKIYDHVKELSLQAHLTVRETIECLLHQHMTQSSEQDKEAEG